MLQHQRERKTKLFGKKFSDSSKAQSAMEYLMTYGWAILIIAVVLAALDFLGVFNGNTFIGSSCLATPGYLCSNPIMTANANGPNLLSFNFEQDTGQTIYEVSFACAASSNSSTGMPNANTANVFQFATSSISSGSQLNISGMQCYGSNANLFQDHPIGSVFSGTLWIKYSLPGFGIQFAKVAKIIAKVELKNLQVYYAPPSPSVVKKVQLSYGAYPVGIAFYNGNGYVTNAGKNTVSVFNYTTAAIIGNITGFDYPTGIAFYNGNGYVANDKNNTISVFNPSTNTITKQVHNANFSNPVCIAFYNGNGYITVSTSSTKHILVFNVSTDKIIGNVTGFTGYYDLAGNIAFYKNYGYIVKYSPALNDPGIGNVSIINPSTDTLIANININETGNLYNVAFYNGNGYVVSSNNYISIFHG